MTFTLENREIVAVYLMLKAEEAKLDRTLTALCARIERALYDRMSIDEFEHLRELYSRNVDIFRD